MMKKLVMWLILLVIGNVIWLSLDKTPPAWDQAAHLKGMVYSQQFLTGHFWGSFADLIKSFYGYPPLVYIVGGIWTLFVGVGISQITFINSLFLIVAVCGVYKLSKNNLLAAVLFSLFPVIYDISRNMLLDLALTGWVVWGLYFWIKKNNTGWLWMLILASLTKLNGFIYFGPMVLISFFQEYKNKEWWKSILTDGIIYVMAVGWWWGINWQNIYQYIFGLAGQGEKLTDPMNLTSWVTWIHYFRLFFLSQLGAVTAILFLIFAKKESNKLVWWIVLTYITFTIIKNKDFRFTMPMLGVVGVWFGWGLSKVKYKLVIGLTLLWMGFNYVENSYDWPIKKPVIVSTPTFLMGDVNWINFSVYPVREYQTKVWPNEKIIKDITLPNSKLLVLMNIAELNDNNLEMYRVKGGESNVEIHGIYGMERFGFDYILLPDEKTESAPFYDVTLETRKKAIKDIWEKIDNYQKIGKYELPNGGKVYLIRPLALRQS